MLLYTLSLFFQYGRSYFYVPGFYSFWRPNLLRTFQKWGRPSSSRRRERGRKRGWYHISTLPDFFYFDGQIIFLWMYLDTPYVLVFYKISPSWIKKKETDWCLKNCPPVTGFFLIWRRSLLMTCSYILFRYWTYHYFFVPGFFSFWRPNLPLNVPRFPVCCGSIQDFPLPNWAERDWLMSEKVSACYRRRFLLMTCSYTRFR